MAMRKKRMCFMIPMKGITYKWVGGEGDSRRILPGAQATEFMDAFYDYFPDGTKKDFDREIGMVFQYGKQVIECLIRDGQAENLEAFDAEFWQFATKYTFLKDVDPHTIYGFISKVMEGRENFIEQNTAEQVHAQFAYQGDTVQHLETFKTIVNRLTMMYPQSLLAITMTGAMAAQADEPDPSPKLDFPEEDEHLEVLHPVDKNDCTFTITIQGRDAYETHGVHELATKGRKPTEEEIRDWLKTDNGQRAVQSRWPYISGLLAGRQIPMTEYEKKLETALLHENTEEGPYLDYPAPYTVDIEARRANRERAIHSAQDTQEEAGLSTAAAHPSTLISATQGLTVSDDVDMTDVADDDDIQTIQQTPVLVWRCLDGEHDAYFPK